MAIALTGSITQLTLSPTGKTWSWSINVPSDASMLILGYSTGMSGREISSANLNGNALTVGVKRSFANNSSNELWYIVNPPTGNCTLSMTIPSNSGDRPAAFFCLKGTDVGASPIRSTGNGTDNNNPTTGNMTGVTEDWGVCLIHSGSISTTIISTDGGNQTAIGNIKGLAGTNQFSCAYKSIASDSSTITMTGSINSGFNGAIIAMMVKPLISAALPRRVLDGPIYGSLRGSVR